MASGITLDAHIYVGQYSQYSVGRPWASGEPIGEPIHYAPCGWREDAGDGHGVTFPPLTEVIARAVARLRGNWPERREATLHFLRRDPWGHPRWDDGLDWTMGAAEAAYHVLGTRRAAGGLLAQPEFQAAWIAALRA